MDLVINYQNFYERRIKDFGTFKYVLRSLDTNANIFDNVYLIYGEDITILPDWLDKSKFTLVKHSDFIDKKRLPTLNQCLVEECLCNIEGLSETFVYMREDTFFMKPCMENDFFVGGKAVVSCSDEPEYEELYDRESMCSRLTFYVTIEKSNEECIPVPEYSLIVPEKGASPMFKTLNQSVHEHLKEIFLEQNKMFEEIESIPFDIFVVAEVRNKQTIEGCERKLLMLDKYEPSKIYDILNTYNGKILCIDGDKINTEEMYDEFVDILHTFFERKFGNKSKYEL